MMEFILWVYFHKDSVTSCKEIEKDCDKKDCNNLKNCDNWKTY